MSAVFTLKSAIRDAKRKAAEEAYDAEQAIRRQERDYYLMVNAHITDKLVSLGIDPYELRDFLNRLPG